MALGLVKATSSTTDFTLKIMNPLIARQKTPVSRARCPNQSPNFN